MSSLNLKQANTIIDAAMEHGRANKINPLAVVVLDLHGNIVSAQRDDNASMFRVDVALGKAWAAVAMGSPSRDLGKKATANPAFFISLAASANGRFLPQTGAVLVYGPDGQLLGSAGASGGTGDEDEACCIKGVEATGLLTTQA